MKDTPAFPHTIHKATGESSMITKFGQITEDAEGNLVFTNFSIDPNHQWQSDEVGIICLVKHRLGMEYTKIVRPDPYDNIPSTSVKFLLSKQGKAND